MNRRLFLKPGRSRVGGSADGYAPLERRAAVISASYVEAPLEPLGPLPHVREPVASVDLVADPDPVVGHAEDELLLLNRDRDGRSACARVPSDVAERFPQR